MSVRFYMDHNFMAAVTAGLRGRGIDCLTAQEDGRRRDDDEPLLERSTALDRVFVTHDVDLFEITGRWLGMQREFAGVVYAPQLGITIGQAVRDLELISDVMEPDEMRNQVIYLPL